MMLRDAAIAALCSALWLVEIGLDTEHGAYELGIGIAAGLATGVVAFLAHEWGHLLGALRAGAVVVERPVHSVFLFHFDTAIGPFAPDHSATACHGVMLENARLAPPRR